MTENRPLTSLRALAAIWVFVAHLATNFYTILPERVWTGMVCGWLGVDVFFVLSGFILASVYRDLRPPAWPAFFARRLLRVFPLNVVWLSVLAILALFGVWTGAVVDWHYLPWHFLMLQSFVPTHRAGWIFVNWSVGIELICYAAFPVAMLLCRRLTLAALVALTLLAAGLSFWAQLHVLGNFWDGAAVLRGGSGFFLGAAVGLLAAHLPRLGFWTASALEVLGFGAVAYGAMGGLGVLWCTALGSWRMASVPIGAAAIILALASDSGMVARVLRLRVPFYLGQISFSIYLLHYPLMIRSVPLVWTWGTPSPGWRALGEYAVLLLLAIIALASVTYHFVELPARRLGRHLLSRRVLARAAAQG